MAETKQNSSEVVTESPAPPTMKIDAPAEEAPTKIQDEVPSNICSPSSNKFSLRGSILKPAQLSLSSPRVGGFTLNPSKLAPHVSSSSTTSTKPETNGEVKFVPLKLNDELNVMNSVSSVTATPSSSFVFGQNLHDRVVDGAESKSSSTSNGGAEGSSSDMLFTSAAKTTEQATNVQRTDAKSLSEWAKEYEESRANKRKYDEVEVKTGEEEETNILNVGCKLFAFDKTTSSWQERGRGTLRLNDFEAEEDGEVQSRLVFRTTGSLRVILNTKIWAEMTVEQASEKSIRLTALDANGDIRVFLIMANIEDSRNLYKHLQVRLQKEIAAQKRRKVQSDSTSTTDSGDK